MEKKDIENHLESMKKSTLSHDEKEVMWNNVKSSVSARPPLGHGILSPFTSLLFNHIRKTVAFGFIVLLLAGSFGTVAFADNAKPNDFLYPIDLAAENIRLAFSSKLKKGELRIKFAVERIEEVEAVLGEIEEETDSTTTAESEASTIDDNSGKNIEHIARGEEALSSALAYLEKNRERFSSEDSEEASLVFDAVRSRLNDIAQKHVEDLEELEVKIKGKGRKTKVEIEAITQNIKAKFKFEKRKDNEIKMLFESKPNNSKKKEESEHDDDEDDEDSDDEDEEDRDDGEQRRHKATICHKEKNTLSIAKAALWAHLKHGDTVGACDKDEDPDPDPDPDTQAPNITSIVATADDVSANVSWSTSEDATGVLWYSTSSPVIIASTTPRVGEATFQQTHEVNLSNLLPSTTYRFVISARDRAGNTATSSEEGFATENEADTTSPVISGLSVIASTTNAVFAWSTNESTTGIARIGTTSPLTIANALGEKTSSSLTTAHEVLFDGLLEETTYYIITTVRDTALNHATSTELSFTTEKTPEPAPEDTTAPTISALTTAGIASTTANVLFNTNEPATSRIWFGTTTPTVTNISPILENSTATTTHNFLLSSLATSTPYYYIVSATDEANNTATSSEVSFVTE